MWDVEHQAHDVWQRKYSPDVLHNRGTQHVARKPTLSGPM